MLRHDLCAPWSTPYLRRGFFVEFARRQPDAVRFLVEPQWTTDRFGLLPVRRPSLVRRYWCTEHLPFLHFELAYQAIEYCIATGLRLEGGAQGEHSFARGLLPVVTYSAHWIRDQRFRHAVQTIRTRERRHRCTWTNFRQDALPFHLTPARASVTITSGDLE